MMYYRKALMLQSYLEGRSLGGISFENFALKFLFAGALKLRISF